MTVNAFIKLDLKRISRELMLGVLLIVAPFLALMVRFFFPLLAGALSPWIKLESHAPLVLMFILNLGPLLTGMMTGLLLVDEADDHILQALAVTPPGKRGFLRHRLTAPYIWTVLCLLPVPFISGLDVMQTPERLVPVILILALGAPFEALIIAAFAGNKIEAMAVGKMTGFLFLAPFIAWFAPGPLKLLGSLLPGLWPSLALFSAPGYGLFLLLLLPSLILNGLGIRLLLFRFDRRVD